MAGVTIHVTLNDAEVRAALNRLLAAGRDMTPLMRDIGEHLLNTTRERFVSQQAPDGTKNRKNKASIAMVAGVSVRSLWGSTSVREPTKQTNRGRGGAISPTDMKQT